MVSEPNEQSQAREQRIVVLEHQLAASQEALDELAGLDTPGLRWEAAP